MLNIPFKPQKENPEETKPVRRRRKKEEIQKPWGRIERIIILLLLIGIPLISLILLINSKRSKTASPVTMNVPIVTKNQPITKNTDDLKNELLDETKNLQGTYGIWLQSLDNSYQLGINENEQFEGASLFKLPMMIAYFKALDQGQIDPNTTYTLKNSDKLSGSGILSSLPEGSVVTYKDLVRAMGKYSDNTAFQIIGNILGFDSEENVISELSMQDTQFSDSLTTPYDIGQLFYKLINTKIISQDSKKEFIDAISETGFEDLIPKNLPPDIKVAHKYAQYNSSINDAGIIYAKNPYILVIMTKDADQDEAYSQIPKISQLVYDWAK